MLLNTDWSGYDLNGGSPGPDVSILYSYQLAPSDWSEKLALLAKDAYIGCGGTGYGRVDIRTKNYSTNEPYVLEVNSNCGLTIASNTSSLGEILKLAKIDCGDFCEELIQFAFSRDVKI